MERRQPSGLAFDLLSRRAREPFERLDPDFRILELPDPGHDTVDEEHRKRLRSLVAEDQGPVPLGQDAGASDAGSKPDSGTPIDAGPPGPIDEDPVGNGFVEEGPRAKVGCGCSELDALVPLGLVFAALVRARRRR